MPPAAQSQLPAQVNPALIAALRARAAAGATGAPQVGAIPNGMNAPVQQAPGAPQVNMARPGAGTPAQGMMKAATTAQSPMQDPETRASAKDLIMKLMKHM
jgi:hypothetical protein